MNERTTLNLSNHRQPISSRAADAADGALFPPGAPSATEDAEAGERRVPAGSHPSPMPSDPAGPLEVVISDDIALFLRLSAEHQGVSREEIVLRAIPHFAATVVGLPGLADAIQCGGRAEVARRSHKPEVVSSNLTPATTFNEEGELTEVPAFERVRLSRFANVPEGKGAPP